MAENPEQGPAPTKGSPGGQAEQTRYPLWSWWGFGALVLAFVVGGALGVICLSPQPGLAFVSQVIQALGWPGLIAMLAFIFREDIKTLCKGKHLVKGPAFEAHLNIDREEKWVAEAIREGEPSAISDVSARRVIEVAWKVLEDGIRELLQRKGNGRPPRTWKGLGKHIRNTNLLQSETCDLLDKMRESYRKVRDDPQYNPDPEIATFYYHSALKVVSEIEEIEKQLKEQPSEA